METTQILKDAILSLKLHDKDEFSLLGIVSQLEDEIKLLEANEDSEMLSKL
jgi:hypothetical protein